MSYAEWSCSVRSGSDNCDRHPALDDVLNDSFTFFQVFKQYLHMYVIFKQYLFAVIVPPVHTGHGEIPS